MNYEKFDNTRFGFEEREEKIIELLKERPMTTWQIFERLKLTPRSQIQGSLLKLRKKRKIVTKRYIQGEWYYGLVRKMRDNIYTK